MLSSALERESSAASSYTFLRGLLRAWFAVFFRKIRLLEEGFPRTGATILLVNHPASFLDALIMVTVFERPLRCLMDQKLLQGGARSFLARALGVIPYSPDSEGWRSAVESCHQVLSEDGALVVFAEPRARKSSQPAQFALRVAELALEAASGPTGQPDLPIFPIHLLLPVAPSKSTELVIYVDAPLVPRDYAPQAGDEEAEENVANQRLALAAALDRACRQNAFRLQPENLEQFLSDLEDVLRADLEEDWSSRPNWKQKVDGFQLSQFVENATKQMNSLHPGRLVAVREMLDGYREAQRVTALRQLEAEKCAWLKSPVRKVSGWFELAVGALVAGYGVLNHLVVLAILAATGLLKKHSDRAPAVEWAARATVVLVCYVVQIAMCDHFLGRAAAGYYAVSLPVSGAYFWRYRWLLRERGELLLFAAQYPVWGARLRHMRKQLLAELDAARDAFGPARAASAG